MKHEVAAEDRDLLVRIEAEIDSVHLVVMELRVFKVGAIGFDDIEITNALTKEERKRFNTLVVASYEADFEKGDDLDDPMTLAKIRSEVAS